MRFDEDDEKLEEALDQLEGGLDGASSGIARFNGELDRLQSAMASTGQDLKALERGLSRGVRQAFDGMVLEGAKLSDALAGVALSVMRSTYSAATKPVTDRLSEALAGGIAAFVPFAKGGSFSQGKVMPFAKGGVVSGPTTFPMRGGTGLMGEAGPEAIIPLARGPDGSLGVRSSGGGRPVNITMNIQTPDVQGFQRSRSQIAAQMARALAQGQRNR